VSVDVTGAAQVGHLRLTAAIQRSKGGEIRRARRPVRRPQRHPIRDGWFGNPDGDSARPAMPSDLHAQTVSLVHLANFW
jgi:hypothetical protein